ncbi:hypothetical protein N2152v2_004245 [Parachlorella kessleri]
MDTQDWSDHEHGREADSISEAGSNSGLPEVEDSFVEQDGAEGVSSGQSIYAIPRQGRLPTVATMPHRPHPGSSEAESPGAGEVDEGNQHQHLPPRKAATAPALCKQSSWVKRVQGRNEELRRLFQLPASEQLMDDYVCALKKKVLLQGRLFVFERHLGFYCNLFSYRKKYCVPLEDVVSVERKKNVGFPNSIEVRTTEGRKYFFTSFLSREDAYRLVVSLWRQCSEHASAHPESDWENEGGEGRGGAPRRDSKVSKLLRGVTKMVHRDSTSYGLELGKAYGGEVQSSEGGAPSVVSEGPTDDYDRPESVVRQRESMTASLGEPGGSSPMYARPSSAQNFQEDGRGEAGVGAFATTQGAEPTGYDVDTDFQAAPDRCEQSVQEAFQEAVEPAPPVDPNYKHMMDFELACSPSEFWCRFLSNTSDFYFRLHAAQQHHSIKLGKWQQHVAVGMVRDLQFVSPIKMRMGPPETLCNQMQRYQVHTGQHLVFETSQVSLDIPYGDVFKVESRWDITPSASRPGACHVTVHLRVPFSKNTVWKKFIERGSFESSSEAVRVFKRLAEADVQQSRPASRQAGPAAAAAASSVAELRLAASPPATPPSPPGNLLQQQGGPMPASAAVMGKTGLPAAEQQPSLAGRKASLHAEVAPLQPWSAAPPPTLAREPYALRHAVPLLLCMLCLLLLASQVAILRHLGQAKKESQQLQQQLEALAGLLQHLAGPGQGGT